MAVESVPATYLQGGVGAGRPRMLSILRHTYYMVPTYRCSLRATIGLQNHSDKLSKRKKRSEILETKQTD